MGSFLTTSNLSALSALTMVGTLSLGTNSLTMIRTISTLTSLVTLTPTILGSLVGNYSNYLTSIPTSYLQTSNLSSLSALTMVGTLSLGTNSLTMINTISTVTSLVSLSPSILNS